MNIKPTLPTAAPSWVITQVLVQTKTVPAWVKVKVWDFYPRPR